MDNKYKRLPPFKWYVLNNFPFIEADFDAITNYELLCKIVEYLNLNIEKTNELGTQVENITNWFDNLDVQDEIDNKLDDMAESGQLAEIINEEIFQGLNEKIDRVDNKTPFSQIIDTEVFAQLVPNISLSGFYFSGFAIGNDLLLASVTDGINTNTNKLFLYNITSGQIVEYKEDLTLGHSNDITYCSKDGNFYIACAGGDNSINKIAVYDDDLVFVRDIDMSGFNLGGVFGIAYDEDNDKFYCLMGSNIVKFDSNITTVIDSETLVSQNKTYTQQSIFYHDGHIFNVINIANALDIYNNYNKLDIYNSNLEYIQSSKILMLGEIEGGCYYEDELYLMLQTQSEGIVYKANLYENNFTRNYIDNNIIFNNRFPFTGNENNYYVNNSSGYGFFVDGSSEKPFYNLYVALRNVKNNRNQCNIYLTGDFSSQEISLGSRTYLNRLAIRGTDSSTLSKLGGLNLSNLDYLTLQNLELTKRTGAVNSIINLEDVAYAYISNIKLNGQGTEQNGIRAVNTVLNLSNINFNTTFTDNNIYLTERSAMTCSGTFTINNNKKMQLATSIHKLWYQIDPTLLKTDNSAWNTTILGGGITFNIKDITLDGNYRIESGNTASDAPTGLTQNSFRLNVKNIANSIVYTLIPYQQNKLYKGILAEGQSSIDWEEII